MTSSVAFVKKILILTANPRNVDRLRLDEEVREIQAGLERSRRRDQFEIISRWAVRTEDLRRALLDFNPQIVHFSGHGVGNDGLALEDEAGQSQLVSSMALAQLFRLFGSVECVLLNACYSEVQAEAIHEHIDCVIGMNEAIGDRAAINFAVGFYDALGAGRSYKDAFQFGCSAINLEGISESATPVLKQRSRNDAQILKEEPVSEVPQTRKLSVIPSGKTQIFISYKRADPDAALALELFNELSQQYTVFIDQTMPVGTVWAEQIETELRKAQFLIVLLSGQSVNSEMVEAEISTAHRLAKEGEGYPIVLPVRLNYREPFQYPLSAYLDRINWAFWGGEADTPTLIDELRRTIAGNSLSIDSLQSKTDLLETPQSQPLPRPLPAAQPVELELPEGTMDSESQFYVERPGDGVALSTIQRQGVTLTIKGPRQMGKSSLLIRMIDAAMKAQKRVAYLDFQLFDQESLSDADVFYRQFCMVLTEQLDLPERLEEFWQAGVGNNQRCTRYMQNYVLKELGSPLVLAMDEVDRIFDAEFRSDFFSMLRNWHNNRALPTMRIWKQFDLALVTATEPYHLIENLNQSPFNVGQVILLSDFTLEQVIDLNQRHGSVLATGQVQQLNGLLNGHPYLVRKALYLVASQQLGVEELFVHAAKDQGPFGDHLRYHLFRIYDKKEMVQGLMQVIRNNTCSDERIARLLTAAGLIRQEGQRYVPRCQLYADYFQGHLEC
jgi:AAA-like domain/TIR domain/CHAT domain